MDALDQAQLDNFFATTAISVAKQKVGVGRELSFRPSPRRTVVIHLGTSDPTTYVSCIVSIVLASQASWLLLPRHGRAPQLGIPEVDPETEALVFDAAERDQLCSYLCQRDQSLGSVSSDIYAVSCNGNVIVTWDHHTADEGLNIDL